MKLLCIDLGFPNQGVSDSPCWLDWRPAWMGKVLSLDLRKRLVAAVITGGLSCNQAAKQFGLPSARRLDGCDGSERPAAWRPARLAATGRRRFPANTVSGC